MTEPTHGQRIVHYPDAVYGRTILKPPIVFYGQNIFRESLARKFQRQVRDPAPLYGQEMWRALVEAGPDEGSPGHSVPVDVPEEEPIVGDLLWIDYWDTSSERVIRQAEVVGPLDAKYLVWTSDPIALPVTATAISNIASQDADICYVATVKTSVTHNIKILKANKPALLASEIFTHDTTDKFGDSDGEIEMIWPYDPPNVWFNVWRLITGDIMNEALHGLWRSQDDGDTWAFVHRGYDEPVTEGGGPNITVHAFAIATTGPHAGRAYTIHENTYKSPIGTDDKRCVLSYSDDYIEWIDVLNTTLENFGVSIVGSYGFVSLYPVDDGSGKVYYSTAELSLSMGMHYYVPGSGPVLSDYPAFGVNGGLDIPYYLTPDQRLFLAEDVTETPAWLSTDAGSTYSDAAFADIPTTNIHEHRHKYSMLPGKDWLVVTPDKDLSDPEPNASIFLSTELGIWQELALPDLPSDTYIVEAVTWVGGRH